MAMAWLTSAACAGNTGSSDGTMTGRLTIFAAASLSDAFNEIATAFEAQNRGADVVFNFGGSPTLRTQLEQGARADVFASADQRQMELARGSGLVSDARVFARNSLVVILPASNTGRVQTLADLRRPGVKFVVANPEVPAGAYTRQVLQALERDAGYGAGFSDAVLKNVVSLESNVKQVVAKVELGEADAGIVYSSDASGDVSSRLRIIAVPPQFNVTAEYPIAVTRDSASDQLAQAFVEFVLSPEGQSLLEKHGFQPLAATAR